MLPYIWTTLFCMAFVTELVDIFCLDHTVAQCTVWVMAVRAFNLAFDDRVVGKFVGLRTNIFVTFKAFLRLLCLRF